MNIYIYIYNMYIYTYIYICIIHSVITILILKNSLKKIFVFWLLYDSPPDDPLMPWSGSCSRHPHRRAPSPLGASPRPLRRGWPADDTSMISPAKIGDFKGKKLGNMGILHGFTNKNQNLTPKKNEITWAHQQKLRLRFSKIRRFHTQKILQLAEIINFYGK